MYISEVYFSTNTFFQVQGIFQLDLSDNLKSGDLTGEIGSDANPKIFNEV